MTRTAASRTHTRLNITLPLTTVGLLDRVSPKGTRSRFIDEAIRSRIAVLGRTRLREQLAEGYAARAARDLRMVEEWFAVDEEAWQLAKRPRARK